MSNKLMAPEEWLINKYGEDGAIFNNIDEIDMQEYAEYVGGFYLDFAAEKAKVINVDGTYLVDNVSILSLKNAPELTIK